MADGIEMLCQLCQSKPVTYRICLANTGETQQLCIDCYKLTATPEQLAFDEEFAAKIRNGKCRYCGAPPVGGSGGVMPLLGEILELWCEACRLDLVEFWKIPENAASLGKDFPFGDDVAIEQLNKDRIELELRQEEFMKRKVRERLGGN
jgi:hypothetical protein